MKPAITTLDAAGLRAAALVLRDVLAATSSLTDAAAVRAMMEREAAIAEAIVANADAEDDEDAQAGLADAVAEHLAQAGPSSARATRVAPSAPALDSGHFSTWTAERKALLAARYPEGEHEEDLRAALNALPGMEITSRLAVHRQAVKMGLRRLRRAPKRISPEGMANMRAAAMRAREARREKVAPPPAPHEVKASPAPDDGSPPDWDDEAQEEARTMLAAGRGARDLSKWFHGSLAWWQAWCERERARQRSAA
jgi:hypothetical protein